MQKCPEFSFYCHSALISLIDKGIEKFPLNSDTFQRLHVKNGVCQSILSQNCSVWTDSSLCQAKHGLVSRILETSVSVSAWEAILQSRRDTLCLCVHKLLKKLNTQTWRQPDSGIFLFQGKSVYKSSHFFFIHPKLSGLSTSSHFFNLLWLIQQEACVGQGMLLQSKGNFPLEKRTL